MNISEGFHKTTAFTLNSAQPHHFFKSREVLLTTHSRTMVLFEMPSKFRHMHVNGHMKTTCSSSVESYANSLTPVLLNILIA